jgi:hypothetical protein
MLPGTVLAVLIAIIEKPPSSNRLSLSFTTIYIYLVNVWTSAASPWSHHGLAMRAPS